MTRTILDAGLRRWEAFASTGRYGFPEHSRVIFRCTSEPLERPRAHTLRGDKSEAESLVVRATSTELRELLAGADPIE